MSVSEHLVLSRRIQQILWPLWWIAMAIATHLPDIPGGPKSLPNADKIAHFIMYMVLTLLGGRVLIARGSVRGFGTLLKWAVVYLVYGALDEWTQGFVGRTVSFYDWLANFMGVSMATFILSTMIKPNASDSIADTDITCESELPIESANDLDGDSRDD